MTANTSAAILNRLFQPDAHDLSPEVAQAFLRLDFRETDHARMAELSVLVQEGRLKEEEREELNEYIRVADMLAVLQSKARRSLMRVGRAS